MVDESYCTLTASISLDSCGLTFSKKSALPGRVGSCPGKYGNFVA